MYLLIAGLLLILGRHSISLPQVLFGCNFDIHERPFCQFIANDNVHLRVGKSYFWDEIESDQSYQFPYYGEFAIIYDGGFLSTPPLTFAQPVCLTFWHFDIATPRIYLVTPAAGISTTTKHRLKWKSDDNTFDTKPTWHQVQVPLPSLNNQGLLFLHEWIPTEPVYLDDIYIMSGRCQTLPTKRGCSMIQYPCGFIDKCISMDERCNGIDDCGDGSDELNCGLEPIEKCQPNFVRCGNGECMLSAHRAFEFRPSCAGACEDYSDQLVRECRFRCLNGHFIPLHDRCNGLNDCTDWSDEVSCPCLDHTYFHCRTRGRGCIHPLLRCDGIRHCLFGEDEVGCQSVRVVPKLPPKVDFPSFVCPLSQHRILKTKICDGVIDCPHGEDEIQDLCSFS